MELDGLEALESLRKLDVSTSTELSHIEDFGDLESFRFLDRHSDNGQEDHLHAIGGLGQLKSLEVLNVCMQAHSMTGPFTVGATEVIDCY